MRHAPLFLLISVIFPFTFLTGQDTLSFGGVYDLPGAEVRSTYQPVSPLAQSFTIEEVYRLPSTFYDPARLVGLLPGVVQSNDQANHLSVRGHSPNNNLWRLNGLAVVNPNHTANAGTFYDFPTLNGGGVNAISAQILDNSGFLAGGLPLEYGFAQGGTFDLRLRPGNKAEHKQQVQAGFIGFDLAAEGPLFGEKTSYLVNGRYSFTGLLGDAGVDFGGEEIRFADVNAHLHHRDEWGEISFFGIWGQSRNEFTAPDPAEQELEGQKDLFDIDFRGQLWITGLTGRINFTQSTLGFGAGYSRIGEADREADLMVIRSSVDYGAFQDRASAYLDWETPLNDEWTLQLGTELFRQGNSTALRLRDDGGFIPQRDTVRNSQDYNALTPYAGVRFSDGKFSLDVGGRYVYYDLASEDAAVLEPRLTLDVKTLGGAIILNAGVTSSMPFVVYSDEFSQRRRPSVQNQVSLSYARQIGKVSTKLTVYTQRTEFDPASGQGDFLLSTANSLELDPFLRFDTLVDTRRYGVELEVGGGRKDEGWYYRGSISLFNSQTQQADESWVQNRFATDFVGKLTVGREWAGQDRKDRKRVLGFNAAFIAHGGERYGLITPWRGGSFRVLEYYAQPNYERGFVGELGTYFRPDLRLYKTKYGAKSVRTLALDVQNVAGVTNVANVYYDALLERPNQRLQLGLIPVLSYRVVW